MINEINEQISRLEVQTIKVLHCNVSAGTVVLCRKEIHGYYYVDRLLAILETLTPKTTNIVETEKSPSNLIWNQIEPAKVRLRYF